MRYYKIQDPNSCFPPSHLLVGYEAHLPPARLPLRSSITGLIVFVVLSLPIGVAAQLPSTETTPATGHALQFYGVGMGLVHQRRFDEAVKVFERGLRLDPSNPALLNAIGAALNLEGNTREAERYFLKALSANPQFLAARKNLAISYFESGEDNLALPQFEDLTRSPSTRPIAFLFLGLIAERSKHYQNAANLLENSGDLVFHYPQALLAFAHSLCESRHAEKAQLLLDRFSALPGVRGDDWFQAGVLYSELGQYQHALDCFDIARATTPQITALDYERAFVLDKLGRSKEALKILQDLSIEKPDASSLNLLARVAENTGDIDLAIQSFRKAAEIESGREETYLDYSALCMNHKNYPLALEVVAVGLSYVPNSYRLRVQRGAVLAELGRLREAQEDFRAAMKLQKDDREARLSLARVQVRGGQFKDAVDALAAASQKYPDDFYVHYYYAFVLLELAKRQGIKGENIEKALRALDRSIRLNPDFPTSYFLLGKIYLDRNPQLAVKQFETCLRLDPQSVSAKYQLGRLLLRMGEREEGQKLLAQVNEQELQQEEEENKTSIQLVRR